MNAPASEFGRCRRRLEQALAAARAPQAEWADNVARGVRAVVEFAAEDPAAARTLTARASSRWREREPEFAALVEDLAALLDHGAPPRNPRLPGTATVVARIARQLNLQLEAGDAGETTELVPDLTFLALMPYLGFAAARSWSQPTVTL